VSKTPISPSIATDAGNWRDTLKADDLAELGKWVESSGIECVARVAAALTSQPQGRVTKPDSVLLLEMAARMRSDPTKTTHAAATEVASEGRHRRPAISVESLITELERTFAKTRTKWFLLAQRLKRSAPSDIGNSTPIISLSEFRAIERLIESLPEAIDCYDLVIAEAKQSCPECVKLLKRAGRQRVYEMIEQAFANLQSGRDTARNAPPRSIIDLIRGDLEKLSQTKMQGSPRASA
jgi:hypothetical protein